jgi:hypothetical protein
MLKQLDPVTVLTNFNQIASAGKEIVETDIPPRKIDTLMELALKAKEKPISSVAFVPPVIYPGSPDFPKMHKMVATKIAKAEAKDNPSPAPSATQQPTTVPAGAPGASSSPSPSSSKKSTKKKTTATLKPGQQTEDLGSVCAAS